MEKRTLIVGLGAVALMTVVMANPAFAQAAGAGKGALDTLSATITGNIGLLLGLGITIAGLWVWIVGQKTGAGLTMVIGGVLLTLAPGLFNGVRNMAGGVVSQFGGDTTNVKTGNSFSN